MSAKEDVRVDCGDVTLERMQSYSCIVCISGAQMVYREVLYKSKTT